MKRPYSSLCLILMLSLGACVTKPPPAPPPVVEAPPSPPAKPTDIVLDEADRMGLNSALREVATKPIDQPVGWGNPDSGKRGAVKVLRDGFDGTNRPCREYHSVVVLDAMYLHSTGFLCRLPDGKWEPVQVRDYPLYRHTS